MKVLLYSAKAYEQKQLDRYLQEHTCSYTLEALSDETVYLAKGFEAVCLFSGDIADESVIVKLAKLNVKYIATRSVGYEHIDIEAANRYGISVANVPAYSPYSVSEFAVTLLLCLVRKIKQVNSRFENNDFTLNGLVGFDLHGKQVGLIGCGRIGSNIARIMRGFGCDVSVYDPLLSKDNPEGFTMASLDTLYSTSDIIFLSCPLNASTHHLINEQAFAKMSRDIILVNTARGAVIDTMALLEVLELDSIGGIAMDVYEYEKGLYFSDYSDKNIDDPIFELLRNNDKVLMTPHIGFLTKEALVGRAVTTNQNLSQWEKLGVCENQLTTQPQMAKI